MNKKKMAFVHSLIALLLCVSMLMGTTFAWFTDSVSSGKNQIVAGNLDVVLEYMDAKGNWTPVTEATNVFEENTLWEPGHTEVVYLRVSNAGTLALKYQLGVNIAAESGSINMAGEPFVLSDFIQFATIEGVTAPYADRAAARAAATNPVALSTGYTKEGSLEADSEPVYVAFVVYMPEDVDNAANYRTGEQPPRIDLGISLLATQFTSESDSFGNTYDFEAGFPKVSLPDTGKADVQVEEGKTAADVTVAGKLVKAEVPAGVSVEEGTTALSLTVTEMSATGSNITASANEELKPVDVHMEGVAADNQTPIAVYMPGFAPVGLNNGNLKLYHVENGETVAMTHVAVATPAHNEFTYDPATGDVVLYLATFSEIAMLADTVNPWNNQYDTSWYNTTDTSFVIANADQFAGFGSIVGGMAKDENNNAIAQDSFSGKTLKLISNINIGDTDSENGYVLYPVGYYNSEGTYEKSGTAITSGFKTFKGTFDGNGHTIANIYQNTWEMKGDNEEYDLTLQYYRDGMGLFGKVYGGTVKNLTVKNFESDGEYTTTGCVAAYADCGATFENIAIFNCNPRVYNIGNGGIVGCVGWYANDAHTTSVTFRNITVDNTNKISALWGSWDVACGGIVGQYYPTSGQTNAIDNGGVRFENCHVAAQIDVYNDVCANYQYYAYRYAGILMGSVRENVTVDGHVYPNMDGITASGCTVHFGDWNDYYYCELVANTTASYTHDHQMSRLTQVAAVNGTSITYLDGATGTVPTSGRYNYVVVNGKTADGKWDHGDGKATCYHFVDGTVWNHADAGTEEVDTDGNGTKETVLKEDKQVIYREFNNLVTGYGWGVTSKAVGEMDGVTILDREEGNSVTKFEAVIEGGTTYRANNERAIGKLFKEATIADPNLAIKSENVQVTVSPKVGTDSTAGGIYTANTTDWTKGTLMFTGKGTAVITITDYYFCTATTVEVEVVENRVTGLSVKTNKNLYDISKNETFSAEDITVSAVFSDGNARDLSVDEFTYEFKENAGDFTTFGEKTGVVTYTYAEETVTAEFKVVAVNVQELSLSGGGGDYELYFEQFGINAVAQQFYMAPGKNTNNGDAIDGNSFGAATLNFATGTVDYTVGWNGGLADNTANHGGITINCTTAPFADVFGYVGYADRVPIAFGVYVDTVDNLTYTSPMTANDQINTNTGTTNSRIFYIQAPLNTMNLSAGEHTVTFVSVFEDGIQTLTTWTVNIGEKEEVDITEKTANVIILAGQSNAYGASALTEPVKAAAVAADYSNIFINYSNINCENEVWKSLYYNTGFEAYHPGVGGTLDGACFGPEVGIAYQLAINEATKDEVWYIIKYTAAGSMLDGQWLEGTYDNYGLVEDMGGYLSDLMIDYVHDSLAKIEAIHGDNVKIRGFAWMQGESDALTEDSARKYQANEAALANKVRNEFASYAKNGNGENIVFVTGAIAAYDSTLNQWQYSDTVNKAKIDNTHLWYVPANTTKNVINQTTAGVYTNNTSTTYLSNSAWVDTSTLLVGSIENENGDGAHYGSGSMYNLGQWFGIALNYLDAQIPESDSGSDSGDTT